VDSFFYRTSGGAEVDLVLEGQFGIIPLEIKHTQSIKPRALRTLDEFVRERSCRMGIVINNDIEARLYSESLVGIPFAWL